MKIRILLPLLALLLPSPALAWWDYGHQTIGRIAEISVRPSTRLAIGRLIGRSAEVDTARCPIRSLAEAAAWPDCVPRFYKERFSHAAPWHFQNIDICKPFDVASACHNGDCVSAQIERQAKLLGDRSLPAAERIMALAFLAHLVGDLHQPLHVADRGDKGGNGLPASYGLIAGRTNLHMIWDGYLGERGISSPAAGALGILRELPAARRTVLARGSVEDWARESWQLGRDLAYGTAIADPCGAKPHTRPLIDEATTRRIVPAIRTQAARGGLRLARLLDEALG